VYRDDLLVVSPAGLAMSRHDLTPLRVALSIELARRAAFGAEVPSSTET
jgi:hypothetical protein